MDAMVEIGGLWASKDKSGNSMMSGYLGNAKLLIFKNTYKDADNQPDYRMYVAKKEKREEDRASRNQANPTYETNNGEQTDDVPF